MAQLQVTPCRVELHYYNAGQHISDGLSFAEKNTAPNDGNKAGNLQLLQCPGITSKTSGLCEEQEQN